LYGVTFSPLPPTEGDVAARRKALVPQFSGAPASVMSTPTFRPTAQAVLPTPLLRRPEEIGRAAFRPVLEESQFPALRPAETIEEIDQRLSAILPPPLAPVQAPIIPESAGSIFGVPEAPQTTPLTTISDTRALNVAQTSPYVDLPYVDPSLVQSTPSAPPPPPPSPQSPIITILRAL
jgi:hypothetical protein